MPIYGNTVGTSQRPADWAETSPSQVDHIKNKPGFKKGSGATEATADIDMKNHALRNLKAPSADSDACTLGVAKANAKNEASSAASGALSSANSHADSGDSKTLATAKAYASAVAKSEATAAVNNAWRTAKGTLTRGGWSGRWQNISCPGLTSSAKVIASADGSSASGTRAWQESDVWAAQQVSGAVRFYYYGDAPSSDIPVVIHYEVGA